MLRNFEKKIISSLYFELENKLSAVSYKHGVFRTVYVLVRALWARSPAPFDRNWTSISTKSICFVFFQNELNAALKNKQSVRIDEIVKLNSNKLDFLIRELGFINVMYEVFRFLKISVELKGWKILSKLAHPTIGWLLYIYFKKKFIGKPSLRIVSFNLIHPSSLGISWAAYAAQLTLDYCEHAGTTSMMLSNLEIYRNYYVSHNHTKSLLASSGLQVEKIFLLYQNKIEYQWPPLGEIGTIGFCINDFDSISTINMVTKSIKSTGCSLVYRVHDADQRYVLLSELAIGNNFEIESAKNSKIEDFLSRIDLLIAGDSNVIGDALIACKPVIYFWSGDLEIYDYYGFVKFYKIETADTEISLNIILNQARFSKANKFLRTYT